MCCFSLLLLIHCLKTKNMPNLCQQVGGDDAGGVGGWGQSQAGFEVARCSVSTVAFIRDPQSPSHHAQALPTGASSPEATQRKTQILDIRVTLSSIHLLSVQPESQTIGPRNKPGSNKEKFYHLKGQHQRSLHVIVLYQHQPHRLHKPRPFFTKITLSMRYHVCLHFVHIQ